MSDGPAGHRGAQGAWKVNPKIDGSEGWPSFVFQSGLIPPHRCAQIVEQARQHADWEDATVIGKDGSGETDAHIRRTRVTWIPIEANEVALAVRDFGYWAGWMLGLPVHPQGPETLQMAWYQPGDFYKSHKDNSGGKAFAEAAARKVSVCVPLTDDPTVVIDDADMPPTHAGDAIAFDSTAVDHHVDPVDVERFSLVGWFPGDEVARIALNPRACPGG